MTRVGMIAGAVLTSILACAASSCSAEISDGPPQTWCADHFGTVRSPTAKDSPYDHVYTCSKDEVCTFDGETYGCCDLIKNAECGRGGGTEDALFCNPGDGWERLPMDGNSGTVCAPNETCAARKGNCDFVCCDPRTDPECGDPSAKCADP